MTALTVQNLVDAGTKINFGLDTPATSMTAEVGSGHNTFVVIKNGSGSALTLGITVAGKTSYGVANPAVSVTIAATTGECWLPLRKEHAGVDTPGIATLALPGTLTSVTVALVRMS